MTETLYGPPPAPPPVGVRRLERDPGERVVAGVCAAFGRYTGTDPVLWRVTVAVLAAFGGVGIALYLLGWLLVPSTDDPRSALERLLRRPDRSTSAVGVVAAVVVGLLLLGALDDGPGAASLVVVLVVALLVARERGALPWAGPTSGGGHVPAAPVYGPVPPPAATYGPASWSEVPTVAVPRPPRERSVLGALTLSAAVLLTGLLLLLREAGVDGITVPRVVAAALLVVGAGLVVGTWLGRARGLFAVGLLLCLLLGATAAAGDHLGRGVGERTWVGRDGGSYELGAGEGVLDLRQLGAARSELRAEVGAGRLVLLVPEDLAVRVSAEVGFGELSTVDLDGISTVLGDGDDTDLREEFVVGDRDDVSAEVELDLGVGELEVRRVAA